MKAVQMNESQIQNSSSDTNEEELRRGIELLFFAYRDFISDADSVLEKYKFGRAHHRVIYFVGRYPLINVGQLLTILRITKQSLARVLKKLIETGFIVQRTSSHDHRQRLLELTEQGHKLEQQLWGQQKRRISKAYGDNPEATDGYCAILLDMINDNDKQRILEHKVGTTHPLHVLKRN
jgi:DNA-binding MarR family transcriptional regulator